jgi:hypothetical protein
MALFILAPATTMTGVITPELRLATHIGFCCAMVMLVVAIRAMYMRLRLWGLAVGHDVASSTGYKNVVL